MRILLVQPDYQRRAPSAQALQAGLLPSRSLVELAGVLTAAGHEAQVLDPLSALRLLDSENVLDMEIALQKLLAAERFDAVGIAVYTATRREAHRLAAAVKRHSRSIKVIAGGPHASLMAASLLQGWRELDFVCLGAAEKSLPGLLDSLAGRGGPAFRVKNIAFRMATGQPRLTGKPEYHADLTQLPPVRYDRYREHVPEGRLRRVYVMTARGCTHWCNFCSQLWKKVLLAPPEQIAAEVRHLVEECGTEEIIFYDDCFGMREEHARAVLKAVKELGLAVRLQAVTRFDAITPEWLELFREAGGRDVFAGLESGAPRLRKRMNKHMRESDLCRGAELVREFGLRLGVFLMFGFPNEEEGDVAETCQLLKKMEPAQVMSTVFDIKPGDLIFQFALSSGTITAEVWMNEETRIINGMEPEILLATAARAMAFDRIFTREVLMPEHDPSGFILGLEGDELEALIAQEIARWS